MSNIALDRTGKRESILQNHTSHLIKQGISNRDSLNRLEVEWRKHHGLQ
jgi:hypothetical protein